MLRSMESRFSYPLQRPDTSDALIVFFNDGTATGDGEHESYVVGKKAGEGRVSTAQLVGPE